MNAIPFFTSSSAGVDVAHAAGVQSKPFAVTDEAAGGMPFAKLVEAMLAEGKGSKAEHSRLLMPILEKMMGTETADGMPELSDEPDQAQWNEALSMLAAAILSLSAEQMEELAAKPEVKEWTALVNAELAMAGEEPLLDMTPSSDGAVHKDADVHAFSRTSWETSRIGELAERLAQAAKANPASAALTLAVEQGVNVLAKAMQGIVTTASGDRGAVLEFQAAAERIMQQQMKTSADDSQGSKISQLLRATDAQVETVTRPTAQEGTAPQARGALLAAMEAKAGWTRFALTGEAGNSATSEHSLNAFVRVSGSDEAMHMHWNGLDSMKASMTEAAAKAEAPLQRVPIHQLFEQLNGWMAKKIAGAETVRTETLIRLVPEHLGSVEVKLAMNNGQLTASIMTESALAKEVLEQNLAVLRTNLQQAGVSVEKLTVTQQQPATEMSGMNQDGRQQQSSGRENKKEASSQKQGGQEDWLDIVSISDELEQAKLAEVYGNTFQAEA